MSTVDVNGDSAGCGVVDVIIITAPKRPVAVKPAATTGTEKPQSCKPEKPSLAKTSSRRNQNANSDDSLTLSSRR